MTVRRFVPRSSLLGSLLVAIVDIKLGILAESLELMLQMLPVALSTTSVLAGLNEKSYIVVDYRAVQGKFRSRVCSSNSSLGLVTSVDSGAVRVLVLVPYVTLSSRF